MTSQSWAKEILSTYEKAWVAQDCELILSIFASDATYHERAFERPFSGHEEIRRYWQTKVVEEQSNIKFQLLNYYTAGDTLIAEWEAWFDSNVENKKIHLKEVAIMEIIDGKIQSLREYWQSEKQDL